MDVPPRREFKYLLPPETLPALRERLRAVAERDPYAGPDGTYLLRSLYLDTRDCRLFHANEREAARRFKVRVRGYPESPAAPVFLEVKHRDGDVIRKLRASLPAGGWADAVRRGRAGPHSGRAFDDFVARTVRFDLRPTALVQYRREAWISRIDDYARVSIDFRVECRRADGWSLDAPGSWRPVDTPLPTSTPRSVAVLELKWAEVAPRWMSDLVGSLGLLRAAFSKYCYSMRALADDHYVDYRDASPGPA